MRKCLPQLLKSRTFLPFSSIAASIAFVLPEAEVMVLPTKSCTASFNITMDGPSGIDFLGMKSNAKPKFAICGVDDWVLL